MRFLMILTLMVAFVARAENVVKHRFLVFDEAQHKLTHIDENDAANNWKLPIKSGGWDIQLIGDNKLLATSFGGYYVVDLKDGKLLETVKIEGIGGVWSYRRMPDGSSIAICMDKGEGLYAAEISKDNKLIRKAHVPDAKKLRFGRVTAEGHALAVPNDELIEWDLDGKIINRFKLPLKDKRDNLNSFMGLKDKEGNYWVSYGYGKMNVKISPKGELLETFDHESSFYAGFQRLENGHLLQTQWAGHKPENAGKCKQLVEFNPKGEVVWSYHNIEALSCPVSVILLDDLSTEKLATDLDSVLKN